jgi:hypothetical protein
MTGRIAGPQFIRGKSSLGRLVFPSDSDRLGPTMAWLTDKKQGAKVRYIDRKSDPSQVVIDFEADPRLYDHIEKSMGLTGSSGGQSQPLNATQAVGQTTPDPSVRPVISVQPSTSRFDNNLAVAEQKQQDLRQAVKQSMAETNQPYTPSPAMQGVIERMNAGIERRIKGDPVIGRPTRQTLEVAAGLPKGTRMVMEGDDGQVKGDMWVHPNRESELESLLSKNLPKFNQSEWLEKDEMGVTREALDDSVNSYYRKLGPGRFRVNWGEFETDRNPLLKKVGYALPDPVLENGVPGQLLLEVMRNRERRKESRGIPFRADRTGDFRQPKRFNPLFPETQDILPYVSAYQKELQNQGVDIDTLRHGQVFRDLKSKIYAEKKALLGQFTGLHQGF